MSPLIRDHDRIKNLYFLKKVLTFVKDLGFWCLMPPSPIFQLYRDSHIFLLEYPLKTTDLQQVADKTLSHNIVSSASSLELD